MTAPLINEMTFLPAVWESGFGTVDLELGSDRQNVLDCAGALLDALQAGDIDYDQALQMLRALDVRPSPEQARAFLDAVVGEAGPALTARDPVRFPRATAYAARPDLRRVPGEAVAVAYAQLGVLGLMTAGVSRYDASLRTWQLFYDGLLPVCSGTGRKGRGLSSEQAWRSVWSQDRRPRPHCMAAAAGYAAEAIRVGHAPSYPPDEPPLAWLDAGAAADCCWMLDAVRRVCNGVSNPLLAARQARDKADGRPRQKRAPLEPRWLAEQVDATRDAVWLALCSARSGGDLLWLRLDDEQPPRGGPEYGEEVMPHGS